jgi:thiol-disulfide isomerase/thioredoxin
MADNAPARADDRPSRRRMWTAAAAVLVVLAGGATAVYVVSRDDGPAAAPGGPSFNAAGLPPVHTDPCPASSELLAAPATGAKTLPDISLQCIGAIGSDETVSLRRLGGKPTVVNLWASWCEPCKGEMPAIENVYAAAGGKVRILGINTKDARDSARASIGNTGVKYPSLADPSKRVWTSVGGKFLPTTLFVDAGGHVVFTKLGPMDEKTLRELIATHLAVQL